MGGLDMFSDAAVIERLRPGSGNWGDSGSGRV